MRNSSKLYVRLVYLIYALMLMVGGVLRMELKLLFTDLSTGFHLENGWISTVFYIILGAGCGALLLTNVFRRGTGDYHLDRRGAILPILAILMSAGIFYYVWAGLPFPLGQPNPETSREWENTLLLVNQILGSAAAISFLGTGIWGLLGKAPPALLSILPVLWQVTLLISRFNGYHSVMHIPEYLLAILFMLLISLFYMGHARTMSGLTRRDGRNYVISSGLCASICGFFLVIPNYVYMALNGTGIPVPLLSLPESLYVLCASVYALGFAVSYTRSLHDV